MTVTKSHAETAAEAALHERPPAPISKSDARAHRPSIVGPDSPEEPFPIILSGTVQHGFGRGGKDLGCPTANLPDESLPPMSSVTQTGVYYGFAQVTPSKDGQSTPLNTQDTLVYPMVMSLGWNPFYKNKQLTAEIHIMHDFQKDFYGHYMQAIVLGYIRPELDYVSREALIQDIETDKQVALNCLARPEYEKFKTHKTFTEHPKL
ncbi:riboflavin kinase [Irpex lacteus]|nr:riboflavin kinase [Irpex lacteus]